MKPTKLLTLAEVERQHILYVSRVMHNDVYQAAEVLGIGFKTLYRKLHEYGAYKGRKEYNKGRIRYHLAGEQTLAEVERQHFLRTVQALNGDVYEAATVLGVGAKTLYRKLHEYGAYTDRLRVYHLQGRTFGKLSVIRRVVGGWVCQCECGKEVVLESHILVTKKRRHCGCAFSEARSVGSQAAWRTRRAKAVRKGP